MLTTIAVFTHRFCYTAVLDRKTTIGDRMSEPLQWILLVFFLGPLLGFAQDSRSTVEILETEVAEHRIGDRGPIYTNLGNEHFTASFEVLVGTDGKAVSARTSTGFIANLTPLQDMAVQAI